MRILVTGCHGYIGSVMMPVLADAGHDVVGLDSNLFEDCVYGPVPRRFPCQVVNVRDVESGTSLVSMPSSTWRGSPTIRWAISILN